MQFSNLYPVDFGRSTYLHSFFIFVILLIFQIGFAQPDIIVPLQKVKGEGFLTYAFTEGRFYTTDQKLKTPDVVTKFRLFKVDLDPNQTLVEKMDLVTLTAADKLLLKNIDTTQYLKIKLYHDMVFLSGRNADGKEKYIIPDLNRNLDFTDDTILVFNMTNKTILHDEYDNFEGQELTLPFETYEKEQIVNKALQVKVYCHSPRMSKIYENPNDNDFVFFVTSNELSKGEAQIDNDCFSFVVSPKYSYVGFNDFVINYDSCRLKPALEKYRFKDSLVEINNQLYETRVTKLGDTLLLKQIRTKRSKNLPSKEAMTHLLSVKKKYLDETIFKLNDFEGKYLLLNFWGTWCKPCMPDFPSISDLTHHLDTSKVKFVSVACDYNIEKVKNFLKVNNYTWLQTFETIFPQLETNWSYMLRVSEYPHWCLMDPQGEIILKKNIPFNKLSEILKDKKLLK